MDFNFGFYLAINLISVILILAGIFFMMYWLFLTTKKDIIETSENILKIGIASYITIIYFMFVYVHVIITVVDKQTTIIQLLMKLISILPFFFLIFIYFNLNRYFKISFNLRNPEELLSKKEVNSLKYIIGKISKDLLLKKTPRILISENKNISPFVFGKTLKKSYIALPKNFNEIFQKLVKDNESIENDLKKFTLTHELSHIKHKDHVFIGLSHIILKSFKYWIFVLIFVFSIFSFFIGLSKIREIFSPVMVGVLYYLALFLISKSVSRNREYLADARASILISDINMKSLTKRNIKFKGKKLSFLEFLFEWFNIFSRVKSGSLSISSEHTVLEKYERQFFKKLKYAWIKTSFSKIYNYFLQTHPPNLNRINCLTKRLFISGSNKIISKESATWIGILVSLLCALARFYPEQVYSTFYLTHKWEMIIIRSLGSFIYISMGILIPFFFFIPLKNSINLPSQMRNYFKNLFNRFFIVYASFIVVNLLISAILFLDVNICRNNNFIDLVRIVSFDYVSFLLFFVFGIFITSLFALFEFYSLSHTFKLETAAEKWLRESAMQMFGFIFILLFILVTFFKFDSSSVFFGTFISASIYFYFGFKFPLIIEVNERYALCNLRRSIRKSDGNGLFKLSLYHRGLLFYFPLIVISIVTNYSVTNDLIYLILVLGSLLICIYVVTTKKSLYRPSIINTDFFLENIHRYLFILSKLDSEKILEKRNLIYEKIQSCKLDNNSYVISKMIDLGTVNSSFNALSSLYYLRKNNSKKTANWILGCENSEGGFAPIPGYKSRLSSTYKALYIINKFRMTDKVKKNRHVSWLKSLQDEKGFFHDSIAEFSKIEQTFYALNSLDFFNCIDIIEKGKCIFWLKKAWGKEKKDFGFVFYASKSLELLGELDKEIKKEVTDNWLLSNSSILRNMRIDKNLTPFYYYFKVAQMVMRNYKEYIKNLMPDLEKNAYASFINYIEKK